MRFRWIAAAVATAAVTLTACTGGSGPSRAASTAPGGGGVAVDGTADIPDAAALKQAAAHLPAEPAAAASALVDTMFGSDARAAVAATGELLRRAGLPIRSGKGPVVALPDPITIVNAGVGAEMLPSLTEQVRDGLGFGPDQVTALLTYLGVPERRLTAAQLVAGLAQWGKSAKDPSAAQYAGAAERALAAKHGQLLDPAQLPSAARQKAYADPQSVPLPEYLRFADTPELTLDPVQTLLLLAHAASDATTKPKLVKVASQQRSGTPSGHHSLVATTVPSCQDVADTFDGEAGGAAKGYAKTVLQDALKLDITEAAGEEAAKELEENFGRYDKFTDILSYLAFVSTIRFDVFLPGKQTTHFLHAEGPHANDIQVKAHAYFKAIVPPEYQPCYALAGIGLPTNKDLKDIRILWTLPNGRIALKPAVVGDRQFDSPISLDEKGTSVVTLTPRREAHPPAQGAKQPVTTVRQQVKATLDKEWLEAHVSDLVPLLFGGPAAIPEVVDSIAWNTLLNMIKDFTLPSRTVDIPVTYHGGSVYTINGSAQLNIIFEGNVGLTADFYSCTGPEGPWQGSLSVTGSLGPLLKPLAGAAGKDPNGSATETARGHFLLNSRTPEKQTFTFNQKYGLVVELSGDAIDKGFQEGGNYAKEGTRMRRIGVASWTIAGVDVRELGSFLGRMFSTGLELPVTAADGDLRCPGTAIYQDAFDD